MYAPDPRYYVTLERDRVRRWYRLWFLNIVEHETQWDDTDELVAAMVELRLEASALRQPTEEEKRPGWRPQAPG